MEKKSIFCFQRMTLKFKMATNIPQYGLQMYTDDICLPIQAPDFESPEKVLTEDLKPSPAETVSSVFRLNNTKSY